MSALPKRQPNKDMDSNTTDRNYFDIIECALRNDFGGVDMALQMNPDCINTQDKGLGFTALMAASARGLENMVAHLLSKPGIDIDLKDFSGKDAMEHGRVFPEIVSKIFAVKHPNHRWKEPNISPV